MTNRERAEQVLATMYFIVGPKKDLYEENVSYIERALDEAEKRGFISGTDSGWKLGKKLGREEMRAAIACGFDSPSVAASIRAIQIEGESK